MKIALYCDYHDEVLRFWSLYNLFESIRDYYKYYHIDVINKNNETTLFNYNVVIFYRCLNFDEKLITKLKYNNIKIGYSIDDLLWIPNSIYYDRKFADITNKYISSVDFYMQYSPEILELLPNKPKINIIPSICKKYIDKFNVIQKSKNILSITISKLTFTNVDITELYYILSNVDNNLYNNIELNIITNSRFNFKFKNIKINYYKPVIDNIFIYIELLSEINSHIICRNIDCNIFNNCKGITKYIEAGITRACLLYSPLPAYIRNIKNGNTGIRCDDNNDFVSTIIYASNNIEEIIQIGNNAYIDIVNNYNMDINCKEFLDKICSL